MSLAVLDLGCGNLGSVIAAFGRLGARAIATRDPRILRAADRVVLPGVGAAGYAMERIAAFDLGDALRALRQPVLGVCLGMHLMFEASEEGSVPCLGLLPGRVRGLTPAPGRPVPHMGWSRLAMRGDWLGLAEGDYLYFAHGFAAVAGPDTVAIADHGGPFAAAVQRGALTGVQFHPEKSGPVGARFLAAWLAA